MSDQARVLQVAGQLQALLQEKARLASENARLAHENTSLQVRICPSLSLLGQANSPAQPLMQLYASSHAFSSFALGARKGTGA